MKIHELQLASSKERKRVGRGISAGGGKTAGRGTKGQKARAGGGVRPGFEGGQNPLAKRLPKKRGFRSLSPTQYQVVNLGELAKLKSATVDGASLAKAGLVKHSDAAIKLLGDGKLEQKLTIKVHAVSATARAAVEAAGGGIVIVELASQPKKATRPTTKIKATAKAKAA